MISKEAVLQKAKEYGLNETHKIMLASIVLDDRQCDALLKFVSKAYNAGLKDGYDEGLVDVDAAVRI